MGCNLFSVYSYFQPSFQWYKIRRKKTKCRIIKLMYHKCFLFFMFYDLSAHKWCTIQSIKCLTHHMNGQLLSKTKPIFLWWFCINTKPLFWPILKHLPFLLDFKYWWQPLQSIQIYVLPADFYDYFFPDRK